MAVEISASTESIDLHGKKLDFERAGVREYLVVATRLKQVFWFVLRNQRFEPLQPGPDGVLRSETFPGLWLDPQALISKDDRRLFEVAGLGLASAEHAAFVAKLAAKKA